MNPFQINMLTRQPLNKTQRVILIKQNSMPHSSFVSPLKTTCSHPDLSRQQTINCKHDNENQTSQQSTVVKKQSQISNETVQGHVQQYIFGTLLRLFEEVSRLKSRIEQLESKISDQNCSSQTTSLKPKRQRRRFSELLKNFKCPHTDCLRQYGTQVSLKLHLRLKHP